LSKKKQRLHERPEWDISADGKENVSYLLNQNKRLKLNPRSEDLCPPKEQSPSTIKE
jgi:hypothetical protein